MVRESEVTENTISKRNRCLSSEEFYFATVGENYVAIDTKYVSGLEKTVGLENFQNGKSWFADNLHKTKTFNNSREQEYSLIQCMNRQPSNATRDPFSALQSGMQWGQLLNSVNRDRFHPSPKWSAGDRLVWTPANGPMILQWPSVWQRVSSIAGDLIQRTSLHDIMTGITTDTWAALVNVSILALLSCQS